MTRIGIGHDTHRLAAGGPLRLGGIDIPHDRHLLGHSDADVLLHAVTDALLGAAAVGDIGELFPDTDPAHRGRDSAEMLAEAADRVRQAGYRLVNLDCIVFAQRPKLSQFKPRIAARIAEILRIAPSDIGVKAKTGEGVGPVGGEEVMMAQCVCLLEEEMSGKPCHNQPTNPTTIETHNPMTIRVYNTLTKTKSNFETVVPGKVGIYLCGPTVYDKAHIGHTVGPVIFDAIKRYLTYSGYQVTWVVNITDVDDKLINKANQRGITMAQVAEENTRDYLANLAALGVDQIDAMPKATENIDEIIRLIQDLISKGFAYESSGDVYFDVARDPGYGKLSNRTAESLQGEGGEAAARKRSAGDFALWKSAKPGEPSWDSPWGPGRPGWHIECSAMSRRLLGETFDIHGGGLDLVFPHHENELAQSECCHGKPMVNYWLHNGLMRAAAAGKVGGRSEREAAAGGDQATVETKISRSKGAGGLADLIARQGGQAIRFFLLKTHYRSTIVFSEEGVAEAGAALETFERLFERYQRITGQDFFALPAGARRTQGQFEPGDDPLLKEVHACRADFLAKMDDDFNTGGATSDLFELARSLNKFADQQRLEEVAARDPAHVAAFARGIATLRELTALLGLFRQPRTAKSGGNDELLNRLMTLILELRADARKRKDFASSDKIRDTLASVGITIEDRKDGSSWRMA